MNASSYQEYISVVEVLLKYDVFLLLSESLKCVDTNKKRLRSTHQVVVRLYKVKMEKLPIPIKAVTNVSGKPKTRFSYTRRALKQGWEHHQERWSV